MIRIFFFFLKKGGGGGGGGGGVGGGLGVSRDDFSRIFRTLEK